MKVRSWGLTIHGGKLGEIDKMFEVRIATYAQGMMSERRGAAIIDCRCWEYCQQQISDACICRSRKHYYQSFSARFTKWIIFDDRPIWLERNQSQKTMEECLPVLNNANNWFLKTENMKVNDLTYGHWMWFREYIPEKQSKIRNVDVKMKNDTFKRPVTKICRIPSNSSRGELLKFDF